MVKVTRSTVIDAPISDVWAILRDFNAHDQWHPIVRASRIEGARAPDEIGCVRDFALEAGGAIREQLLSLSDRDHTFTYCILDAPAPLINYVATVRLRPVTDGARTFWQWESRFDPPPEREAELVALVGTDVYEGGFEAVRRLLRGESPKAATARRPAPASTATPLTATVPATSGTAVLADAIVVEAYGGPGVLRPARIQVPAPGPGEVRLRHTAIGVNYIDVYCRTGYFPLLSPPGTPGMEAAGVVTEIGAGVRHLSVGDRVGYACPPVGAYASDRTIAADLVVGLPDDIDDVTAAAALLKGMTAEFLLRDVHPVTSGDVILVHAAAGGVGQFLCQLGRSLGATVIGTVGSADKAGIARSAGCAHPIVYTREDFVARVAEITDGRGVDVAYDAVGRDTFARSFDALAMHGHLVSFGQASGDIGPVDIARFASKSARLTRPNFGHYTDTRSKVTRLTDRLFLALGTGALCVQPPTVLPLTRAAEAHRLLESRATTGSIVLVP